MRTSIFRWLAVAACLSWGCASESAAGSAGPESTGTEEPVVRGAVVDGPGEPAVGRQIYGQYCQSCHGAAGRGEGPAVDRLDIHPADLTAGVFKFRSTPAGELPTDGDLFRTVSRGIARSPMPAFAEQLEDRDIWHVVQYVKTLSTRFDDPEERPERGDVLEIPPRPPRDEASIQRGREVFESTGCPACHGEEGRGDGPAADGLETADGRRIRPANFRRGVFKSGDRPSDVYRTIATGLASTPMAAYGEVLEPDELWDLVHYVRSLKRGRRVWQWLVDFRIDRRRTD